MCTYCDNIECGFNIETSIININRYSCRGENMKKRTPIILLSFIFISILVFQFTINYNFRKEPPSNKWGKEVLIGSGNCNNYPKIIKNKDYNIVAFDDNNNIKVIKTDSLGKKIKEELINTKNDFIKDINLVRDNENIYVTWLSSEKGTGYIEIVKLDSDFKIINQRKINNVIALTQINDDVILLGYKDKIEVWDIINNTHMYVKANEPSYISGVQANDKKVVVYMDKSYKLNSFNIYEDRVTASKFIVNMSKSDNVSYENIAFSADDKNGYILIEQKVKNEYVAVRKVEFALDGSSNKNTSLEVNGDEYINSIVGVYSKDGARFLGSTTRIFALKKEQQNIIDFTIKDGKVAKADYVSRLRQNNLRPALSGDNAVFLSYKSENMWDVYLTSEANSFKAVNNGSRGYEKKDTILAVLEGFAYSISYIFVYALKWIMPALILIGLLSFFDFTLKEKKKKIMYLIICISTIILKTYVIIDISYGEKYSNYLPNVISSKILGVALCLIIGAITYAMSYNKYKEDTETLPVFSFLPALLIDTILTLMIFIPFLP